MLLSFDGAELVIDEVLKASADAVDQLTEFKGKKFPFIPSSDPVHQVPFHLKRFLTFQLIKTGWSWKKVPASGAAGGGDSVVSTEVEGGNFHPKLDRLERRERSGRAVGKKHKKHQGSRREDSGDE